MPVISPILAKSRAEMLICILSPWGHSLSIDSDARCRAYEMRGDRALLSTAQVQRFCQATFSRALGNRFDLNHF